MGTPLTASESHTVVSIDAEDHFEKIRSHGEEGVREALAEGRAEIDSETTRFAGRALPWIGDGGSYVFSGPGQEERAVLACLSAQLRMEILSLDRQRRSLPITVVFRMAIGGGTVDEAARSGGSTSEAIGRTEKLQKRSAGGRLAIFDETYRALPSDLQSEFSRAGTLFDVPYYLHRRRSDNSVLSTSDLVSVREALTSQVADIIASCPAALKADLEQWQQLSRRLRRCYAGLEAFCETCSSLDSRWSPNYLAVVAETADSFGRSERSLWDHISSCVIEFESEAPPPDT